MPGQCLVAGIVSQLYPVDFVLWISIPNSHFIYLSMTMVKKNIVIVGSTGAVGSKIANECLNNHFNIVLVVRDKKKASNIFGIQNVHYVEADLADLKSVEEAASDINLSYGVNAVINCAGTMSQERVLLNNNLEKIFVINYLSIYLFNKIICEKQAEKTLSKIFTVTMPDNLIIDFDNLQGEKKYSAIGQFRQTNVLKNTLMMSLSAKYKYTDLSVALYHPGFVKHKSLFEFPGPLKVPFAIMQLFFASDGTNAAKQLVRYLTDGNFKELNGSFFKLDKSINVPNCYLARDVQKKIISESDRLIQYR